MSNSNVARKTAGTSVGNEGASKKNDEVVDANATTVNGTKQDNWKNICQAVLLLKIKKT